MFRDFDQSTIHDSSSVISRTNIRNKDYYKKNRISGIYRQIDPITGQIVQQGEFRNGVQVGLWRVIDEDGDQQHFRYQEERVGARCVDGSFSSATGRGACSWHGGVAEWLTENKRYQVGGTGKYEPIETRIVKTKQKLKQELNMNVNKRDQQLLVDTMEKLLKVNRQLKKKESELIDQSRQRQQQDNDQESNIRLQTIKAKYQEQIGNLQEIQAIMESDKQDLLKEKKKLLQKLTEQQKQAEAKIQLKQKQHDQKIKLMKTEYEDKLKRSQREIQQLMTQLKQMKHIASKERNSKQQLSINSDKQQNKKPKPKKDDRENQLIKRKLKVLQQELSLLNKSLYKEQEKEEKSQLSSSYDNRSSIDNEEVFSSIMHKPQQSKKRKTQHKQQPKKKQKSKGSNLVSDSSISRQLRQQQQNQSFSYSKILKSKLFMDQSNKSQLSLEQSRLKSKKEKSMFMKKDYKGNSNDVLQNTEVKVGKFQFKLDETSQEEEGISLKTDSEDENQYGQKKEEQFENKDIFKSIPFKSGDISEIKQSRK